MEPQRPSPRRELACAVKVVLLSAAKDVPRGELQVVSQTRWRCRRPTSLDGSILSLLWIVKAPPRHVGRFGRPVQF
jgi:hypothetical protein